MEQQQNTAETVDTNKNEIEIEETVNGGAQTDNASEEAQAAKTENQQQPAADAEVKERDDYKDRDLRAQAEFQNYKRRTALTRAEAYEDGVRETISALLPAIDNLELALKHAGTAQDSEALTQGVSMTLKLMTDALGKLGLEEVPALGEEFDPEKHNAVMREPGGEENKICEVFQKGYKVHDRMIRYAMVKVYSGAEE